MKKNLKRLLITIVVLSCLVFLAFKLSPYPTVWIVRNAFNKEAIRVNRDLEKFVPKNIETISNVQYDETDKDAYMDIYFQIDSVKANGKLPIIVWTHGGGLISGNKNQLSNYCKILASQGYIVASIDYTVAPEKKYPTPIQQLNKSLAYISFNANKFNVDTSFFVLAGDSGGSMISAATANVITNPNYAQIINVKPGLNSKQLKGLILYCGIYDVTDLNTGGDFGSFLKTVMWAYFGKKNITNDEYAKTASVSRYLSGAFPPSFISAGNGDPLLPQSKELVQKLSTVNTTIDTLFFMENQLPALGHEYQFNFNDAGKLAFERSLKFLKKISE